MTTSASKLKEKPGMVSPKSTAERKSKIHPVVIYPFKQPGDYSDLQPLYEMIAKLDSDKEKYSRPITVIDRKTSLTMNSNKEFLEFKQAKVARHSDVLEAWCVDTCQMWYSGLGAAIDHGAPDDVYWLIPGDFNYGSPVGREVLAQLQRLPEALGGGEQDLCIGEITLQAESSKQLIDTYGTFPMLLNWFPAEARGIRQLTRRPRSEFFAIRHSFLEEVLRQRWYAYEQTTVILLWAIFSHRLVGHSLLGDISDLPLGSESLATSVIQVERIEWMLRNFWLERNQEMASLEEEYQHLQSRSEQIRRVAEILFENALT